MGKKDVVTKKYLSDNEKFADVFNYYIYNGENVIKPDMLSDDSPEELFASISEDGSILAKSKMRDLMKKCVIKKNGGTTYILLGAESAAEVHYALPIKNGLYDFIDYASQVENISKKHRKIKDLKGAEFLSGFSKDDKIKPVITLVIYFGSGEWDGPLTLHEMLDTNDKEVLKYVDNYRVNLIVPQDIEDSEKFSTDFREIVDFIKASGNKAELKKLMDSRGEMFARMDLDTAMVLKECANVEVKIDDKEEKANMCKAIEDMLEDAREEARQEMCKGLQGMLEDAREEARQEMCKAIEEMKEDAREEGIKSSIAICRNLGASDKDIIKQIIEQYSMSENDAKKLVES